MKFLIVDDNPADRALVIGQLQPTFEGAEIVEVTREAELDHALACGDVDAVLTQYRLAWSDGLAVLRRVKEHWPWVPVIMVADAGNVEVAVEGMKRGLSDYVSKRRLSRLPDALQEALRAAGRTGPAITSNGPPDPGRNAEPERRVEERMASLRADAVEPAMANQALREQENALRISEERYRQMFERNRAVKLLIDPDTGRIVQANPAACQFYGYSLDQMLRLRITDVNVLPPEQVTHAMEQALAQERSSFVFPHKLASGELRQVQVYSSPIDVQGRRLLYSIVQDVTERWRAEEALEETTQRLRLLHEIDRAILAAQSPEEIAQAALKRVRWVVACQRASAWLFNANGCQAFLLALDAAVPTRVAQGFCMPRADFGIYLDSWEGGPQSVPDLKPLAGASPFLDALLAEGVRSLTLLPLRSGNQVIGCLNLAMETPDALPAEHMDFARQVADSLAVAIQHARLNGAEQHARGVAEWLRSANMALTRSLDVHAVLDSLLENLAGLVAYDSASILLLQENMTLSIAAQAGYERWTEPGRLEGAAFELESTPSLRELFETQTSLLVPDTQAYSGWQPVPGSEHIRSWLGVPLLAGGRFLGVVSLDKASPNFFTPEHVRLAEAIAAQAATALQNARLYEQVRMSRTQLQVLSRRLVEVQESERRHISRELHDDAGQALASLMVGLRLLEREAHDPEAVLGRAAELRRTADGVLENLHRLAMDLRPASLDHVGLVPALQQYVGAFGRQHDVAVQFDTIGLEGERLAPELETNLYRIVQEALTNVARHSHATQVAVLLERREDKVLAIVEDNGVGFDREEAVRRGRLGLFGMRERAEMMSGSMTIESAPGAGTTVFVEVPYAH